MRDSKFDMWTINFLFIGVNSLSNLELLLKRQVLFIEN